MFLDNTFDVYLYEQYLKEKRNLAKSSLYYYMNMVESFLKEYSDIENIDSYNKYIINHAIKKRTSACYSALKAFIEYKIDDKGKRATMIDSLIKPEIKTSVKRERKYLDEKQLIAIINNMLDVKHKIIALIQDMTGVRSGDVLRIKRGNIIPEIYEGRAVLKIIIEGKGNKRNVIYIHDDIVQTLIMSYITKHFLSAEYYFLADYTKRNHGEFAERAMYSNNYRRYYRDLKSAMYKCGLNSSDFATHDYRRCYARRVWTKYKDLQVLQDLLNHANPATTMLYLKQSGMKNIDYHREMQLQ